jgi:two-component system heavy metal sensor histidine kinase CusS
VNFRNAFGAGAVPHLGRRLSFWLALQTMLGLGLVCTAVYVVAAMTLQERQQETLDHKQQAVLHLMTEGRSAHSDKGLDHMLDDFLTGHDELSLRIVDGRGRVAFERLRQPPGTPRTLRRSFAVALAGVPDAHAELLLDRRPDDALLERLAWTLGLAAVGGALLASLVGSGLVRLAWRRCAC